MEERALKIDFAEDIYGTVKRVEVFWEWIEALRARRGGARLRILDFGCGTGAALTVPIAHGGDLLHGVDAHGPSIALARERNTPPNLTFSAESTGDLLVRGACFDVILCSEVLEHLVDPKAYLRDFHKLLAEEGQLLVSVPNGFGAFENLQRLDKLLHRVGIGYLIDYGAWILRAAYWIAKGRGIPPRPGASVPASERADYLDLDSRHVQFFRLTDLERLFRETGFQIDAARGRVLLCGPYVDFWSFFFSLGGGFLFRLNNDLADRLPLAWAADWMFCLSRVRDP